MTLLDIPEELFVQICGYSGTRISWNIMVSCRSMYKLIECRAIWVNQLHQLSSEHAIVGGTYDLHSMSTSEIRQVVIRPHRFEQAVQFEEIKPIRYQTTMGDEFVFETKLAPGGRWLVTLCSPNSEQGPKFRRIWDLHSKAQVSEPCASLPVKEVDLVFSWS
ncbi:hypothetical protein M407DRAFT_19008 [Tulasnella calospora MUT 4182]|uniref:F-box domain-containing protein n=1 Tax=Tulasnella calospora MUT 4182 TaxID=1051891 RepID=A0A0C3ME01_9AGAM|nr:hypothetical protein M407DRAFT_19008 [Tulasnella calospora MUT 4182]